MKWNEIYFSVFCQASLSMYRMRGQSYGKLVSVKPLVDKQILLTELHTFPKVLV